MKMTATSRNLVAILVVAALAVAFWMLLLGPKREEAGTLGEEADELRATLVQSQNAAAAAEVAKREFPRNYRQLVVLGKAVPASDDTSSLLVELNHVGNRSKVTFESILLGTAEGSASTEEAAAPAEPETPASEESPAPAPAAAAPPTESEAALLPLGAEIGPAGLSVMPYDLTFSGSFFHIADFIKGIDSMVRPKGEKVAVDGRLLTINGFALNENGERGFPDLNATFSVTAYLVPPGEGVTAGATEAAPASEAAPSSPMTTAPPR